MVEGLEYNLVGIKHKDSFEGGDEVMKAEGHQFQKNVVVIDGRAVCQGRGRVRNDRCVSGGESGEVVRRQVRLHEDYDSVGCIEPMIETVDIDQDGAGVIGVCCVEHIGKLGEKIVGPDNMDNMIWSVDGSGITTDCDCCISADGRGDVAWT